MDTFLPYQNQSTSYTIRTGSSNINPREQKIHHFIAYDYSTKEIASDLYVSTEIISSHSKNIMPKIDVKNVTGRISGTFERHMLRVAMSMMITIMVTVIGSSQVLNGDRYNYQLFIQNFCGENTPEELIEEWELRIKAAKDTNGSPTNLNPGSSDCTRYSGNGPFCEADDNDNTTWLYDQLLFEEDDDGFIDLSYDVWENDAGGECQGYDSSDDDFFSTDDLLIAPILADVNANGNASSIHYVQGNLSSFGYELAWRYHAGTSSDPLDFGLISALPIPKFHLNSSRLRTRTSSTGDLVKNAISYPMREVYYEFELTQRAQILISTDNTLRTFDTILELYDAAGNIVAVDDDSGTTGDGKGSVISGLDINKGTYTVVVKSFNVGVGGQFQLLVLPNYQSGPTYDDKANALSVAVSEAGCLPDTLTTYTASASTVAELGDIQCQTTNPDVWLKFFATRNHTTIDINGIEDFDAEWQLVDNAGNRLTNCIIGRRSFITNVGDTYYIRVINAEVDITGDQYFEICITSPPFMCPTQAVLHVDANDTDDPTDDGLSWASAFVDLQDALNVSNACDILTYDIWIADGIYIPVETYDIDNDGIFGVEGRTFYVTDDVSLYGGFGGFEFSRESRNWVTNETVLKGDFTISHLLYLDGDSPDGDITPNTILDGLQIQSGSASGSSSSPGTQGGGVYNKNTSATIRNCFFDLNSAAMGGGAIFNDCSNSNSPLKIYNNVFKSNSSTIGGSAIYNYIVKTNNAPEIYNNTFYRNKHPSIIYNEVAPNESLDMNLFNNIFSGIFGGGTADLVISSTTDNVDVRIHYSIVDDINANVSGIANFINIDPDFVDVTADLYRPSLNSVAVNNGLNSAFTSVFAQGFDGQDRIANGRIDIGAYELNSCLSADLFFPHPINFNDENHTVNTNGMINASNEILGMSEVSYNALGGITLDTGFHVGVGTIFDALTSGCK